MSERRLGDARSSGFINTPILLNDPFNYEHKYPEDPPYQEMAPYAILWKAFLEESTKVDANKVADWTDALDVLLVFAGLFSAVVSTFVTQSLVTLALSLHTGIAIVTSCIVGIALATYTITNILPVYNTACPYKTPLTQYSFPLLRRIANQNFTSKLLPVEKKHPSSLDEAEKQLVEQRTEEIDVNATAWLYGISSNTSVQALVLQALSNIRLRSVQAIKEALSAHDIEAAITSALRSSEHANHDQRFAYERLVKALLRLYPKQFISWNPPAFRQDHSFLPILLNICEPGPSFACQLIQTEIVHPSAEFDVVVWAQLLRNAVLAGFDWLEIERADSHVWNCFINLLLQHHLPYTEDHDLKGDVCELPLYTRHASAIQYGGISLKLMDTRDLTQSTMQLNDAIRRLMCPSLSALMYRVAFCKYDKGESDWTAYRRAISGSQSPVVNVPGDTRLRLALIQSADTQQTSFSSPEDPSYADDSTVGHAISCIRQRNPSLPADVLKAAVLMKCDILLPKFCAQLCQREWLDLATSVRFHRDGYYGSSPEGELFYHFMASAFVKGLGILREVCTANYLLLEPYVQTPSNTLALAELLLLSDSERRRELDHLASFIPKDAWVSCLSGLRLFLHSENLKEVYEEQSLYWEHPYCADVKLTYDAFEDLDTALLQAARNTNCDPTSHIMMAAKHVVPHLAHVVAIYYWLSEILAPSRWIRFVTDSEAKDWILSHGARRLYSI
ncbi:hypothetical protein CPB85DRAFT_1260373 [Mucidula mucida]|nr:hypothetical protein CPB85DRAFT_1260373 [Mucidula mucida]